MESCLRDKFRRNKLLTDKLKQTGNRELINSYADNSVSNLFWGVVNNKG
jgi:4-hydroxyphenylpyruvate dioxygenase-like putative hemolysin